MQDESRVIERSRSLLEDSPRLGIARIKSTTPSTFLASHSDNDDSDEIELAATSGGLEDDDIDIDGHGSRRMARKRQQRFDEEVYDDRAFYSMLLKVRTFIWFTFMYMYMYMCICTYM